MARCIDCYWFKHQHPAGRDAVSCQELGEKPQNKACPRYKNKDEGEGTNVPHVSIENLVQKTEYKQSFRDILSEVFDMLKDADDTGKEVFTLLRQQGVDADMDAEAFKDEVKKLSKIYALYRLSVAMGIPYVDHIVANEIDKVFSKPEGK